MRKPASILIAAILVLSTGGAASAREFRFRGGGWGHGVGMSQYGAYGLAKKGWSRSEIVQNYYKGTSLSTMEPPGNSVFRVGLLQNVGSVEVRASNGSYTLLLETSNVPIETVPEGQTRRIVVSGGQYQVYNGQALLGAWGNEGDDLQFVRSDGGVVKVLEWGHRSGRGTIELDIVSGSANRAHLVAKVPSEEYLYGLGEVPSSWPMKVLEVQADAGRTYAYRVVAGGRSGCSCEILGDTRDQNYVGWDKEAGTDGDRWVSAVNNTAKQVITRDGEPVTTFYSSSSGGMIEAVERVWGGSPQPHLKAGCDPGDFTEANPNRTWRRALTARETATKLRKRLGWGIAKVTGMRALTRGQSGRVLRMRVSGRRSSGARVSFQASGESIRRALGLKSTRFWVNRNRNVTGAIRAHYDAIRCAPGLPQGAQRGSKGGRWQSFEHGRIYSKSGAGTHYIHGLVLRRYLKKNGPRGRLGYPVSGVKALDEQRVRARFQNGRITCNKATGRCRVG